MPGDDPAVRDGADDDSERAARGGALACEAGGGTEAHVGE